MKFFNRTKSTVLATLESKSESLARQSVAEQEAAVQYRIAAVNAEASSETSAKQSAAVAEATRILAEAGVTI